MFTKLEESLTMLSRYMEDIFLKMQIKLVEIKITINKEIKHKLNGISR